MTEKENLLGYTLPKLETLMTGLGEKPFRGKQLFKWLYSTRQYDFNMMTDFTKELRSRLLEKYSFSGLQLEKQSISKDGTQKFLFRLNDGNPVETVLIPEEGRGTLCISSQSGCGLGCHFCATGKLGLLKNLSAGEIVGQILFVRDILGDEAFSNVVFMGMGEPLNNYENMIDVIKILIHPSGLAISGKKITISTVGITPQIKKLADSGLKTRLAVSLHAATQEKRVKIIPIAKSYELNELMRAIKYFAEKTGDRVTFEYIIFDGINDTIEDIKALSELVKGIPCKINILAYNEVPGLIFKRPSDEKVDWFGKQLYPRAPAVTVRKSRGRDIGAACGQLAAGL